MSTDINASKTDEVLSPLAALARLVLTAHRAGLPEPDCIDLSGHVKTIDVRAASRASLNAWAAEFGTGTLREYDNATTGLTYTRSEVEPYRGWYGWHLELSYRRPIGTVEPEPVVQPEGDIAALAKAFGGAA